MKVRQKTIWRKVTVLSIAVFVVGFVWFMSLPALALSGKFDGTFYSNNDILFYDPEDTGYCVSTEEANASLLTGSNQTKIWNYLTKQDLSPEQVAGILGNIQILSGYSPTANGGNEDFPNGTYGLAGWAGDRRKNLVDYLTKSLPDLMSLYYNEEYSSDGSYTSEGEGYVPKSAKTGSLMPTEDNDKLLIAQLEFLVTELKSRTLQQTAVDEGYGKTEDKEWDIIKKQTTAGAVSDVLVYSFNIPESDIGSIADSRSRTSQTIYDTLNEEKKEEPPACGGSKKQLAQEILDSGNLRYWSAMKSVEKDIIPDIAAGKNDGNTWPCGININILSSIAAITKERVLTLTSLNRACSNDTPDGSGVTSRHYAGNGSAVDIDYIDGLYAETPEAANLILQYMAPFLPNNSGVGQLFDSREDSYGNTCLPIGSLTTLPPGIQINRFKDYCHHLHVDVPPNSDPDLQCRIGVTYGGCDKNAI